MIDWDKEFEAQSEKTASYKGDPAKSAAKSHDEFHRGVRLGWWTAEGDIIAQIDDDDDDDDE